MVREGAQAKPKKGAFAPKRGRPTKAQTIAIEESIVSQARTLFLRNGYAETSMEAVALAAGVSKGTLYTRYPTKSDLFRAIVADRVSVWGGADESAPEPGSMSVAEYLLRFGNTFIAATSMPEIAAFDRLVSAEAERFPELSDEFYRQGYLRTLETLTAGIAEAGLTDGWPVADARGVATAFMAALNGWHRTEGFNRRSAEEHSSFVVRVVAIFVGGRSAW